MLLSSICLLAALARSALAAPTLAFPLAEQSPPVARVDEVFDFTLLPGTFTAVNTSALLYTTTGLPSWVAFNNVSLSFTGTPSLGDEPESSISLTATDTDGTAVTSSFDLIVSTNPAPTVHLSLPRQIAAPSLHAFSSAVPLASNAGIVIHPYWSFSIGFQMDTVRSSSGAPIYYSAHQRGFTSLPDWLEFHNDTMTFYGVAPLNGSYTIVATGSDYPGYSGAQTSFVIQVAGFNNDTSGPLDFKTGTAPSNDTVRAVAGGKVDYEIDLSGLTVGGKETTASEREGLDVSAAISLWNWLSFDSASNKLSGTVPQSYINGTTTPISLPITVANTTSGASVTSYLPLVISPFLFTAFTLPNVKAEPGQSFKFDLAEYITNTTDVSVNATFNSGEAASEWLKFDAQSFELAGTVPNASEFTSRRRALGYDSIDVAFNAASGAGGPVSTASLAIALDGITPATPTSSSTGEPTRTEGGIVASHGGLSTAGKIALGVVLGVFGLILIFALLFFCCIKRRRDAKNEAQEKQRDDDDADSFVAIGSPDNAQDPFSRRGILNPIPHFSSIYIGRPSISENDQRPVSGVSETKPTRMDAMKGIFNWGGNRDSGMVVGDLGTLQEKEKSMATGINGSGSLISSNGEIIRTEGFDGENQAESSFTHTFGSDSDSSRASWESRRSFRWSSAEGGSNGEHPADSNRISSVPSVARPRADFTPRYPRNGSPTAVAMLTRAPSSAGTHATFSEFASDEGHSRSDSLSGSLPGSGSLGSGSLSGSGSLRSHATFPAGPSGLGRFAEDSQNFPSVEEEDEDGYSGDDMAVVAMAERQSFETRMPHRSTSTASRSAQGPRLMPSKERFAYSPSQDEQPSGQHTPSQEALPIIHDDAFVDADEEARRSMIYAPAATDGQSRGLGYPASAIFFGSEPRSSMQPSESGAVSEGRSSTIRVVPPHEAVLSPPLPSVGSFIRHRRNATSTSTTGASVVSGMTNQDGRVMAVANETFSIHPTINPPPTVSLSASTWSSNPPSTYRAESTDGKPLPTWLHFDSRELELWGVPGLANAGEFIHVRIMEKTPNAKRRSDSSQWGHDPQTEREVGRCVIEVVDRIRSPQFALDASPHAI